MECNSWEESGLMYAANELKHNERTQFNQHLSVCTFCAQELEQYKIEKEKFFTTDILCVNTTSDLDNKVITLCTQSYTPVSTGLFSTLWMRRTVFTALIFALGLSAGGYFTYAYYKTKSDVVLAQKKTMLVPVVAATSQQQQDSVLSKSPVKTPPAFQQNRHIVSHENSVPAQGIVTVDLKKEQ